MHSSQRYRRNAEVCLKAAYAGGSHYQNLNLSMAHAWLKLAGHQEAIDRLLTEWKIEQPEHDAVVLPFPRNQVRRSAVDAPP
jgi:hypothetical protein